MVTISLCMIVRNEEKVLGRCLDSAKDIADEIIIVDTGSTDGTKEIARRYGRMTFLWHEIFLFQKQPWIIVCGWMQMTLSEKRKQRSWYTGKQKQMVQRMY